MNSKYEDIADLIGLTDSTRARYLTYMRTRWADEEEIQCQAGYAAEWAERFRAGMEYGASDSIGQIILSQMKEPTDG